MDIPKTRKFRIRATYHSAYDKNKSRFRNYVKILREKFRVNVRELGEVVLEDISEHRKWSSLDDVNRVCENDHIRIAPDGKIFTGFLSMSRNYKKY